MRRLFVVLAVAVALGACSSDNKQATPNTTTPSSVVSTTSSSVRTTSTSVRPTTTSTVVPSTGANGPPGGPTIVRFTGPTAPVECNAPTSVELDWETRGASSVKIVLDKTSPYTYPDGAHRALLYLPCDGKSHTYELQATKDGVGSSQTLSVQTKKSA